MSKIILGHSAGRAVEMDIDVLLRTRLLVQADSGGGKSWMVRRIAEQLFGFVQVIIIDPEGEFASLREKHGYVLVGKGGETPADPRSAAMLAHKLLELKASAVCDIYELKQPVRHQWVHLFLESMIDAPKNLWHPVVIIVDEAHVYVPEKGKGESEASGAMIDLATRGRKRGFCPVFATQRLGKLSKDASSQLQNRLIGVSFEDIDRKRAAEVLGVLKQDEREFFRKIQMLEPGNFFALGRAIATERILFKSGPIETTHPEPGSSKHAAEPPPPPEKVKALLPKLADLPKAAEERAKNIADLQAEIRSLKGQLAARPKETVTVPERVEVPVITDNTFVDLQGWQNQINAHGREVLTFAAKIHEKLEEIKTDVSQFKPIVKQNRPFVSQNGNGVKQNQRVVSSETDQGGRAELSGPEQRIIDAIAWWNVIGIEEPKQNAVAFVAGYTSIGGGAYCNPRGRLKVKGLIDYRGDALVLTAEGRRLAVSPGEAPSASALQQRVLEMIDGPEKRLLEPLIDAYPKALSMDELASAANYGSTTGGAFCNPRGRLKTMGLIEYPEKNFAKAASVLFLE